MIKRLFRIKPWMMLIVAAISGAAVAAEERGDAADTLVTSAISYTASSPAVALEVAQLQAVLEATHQVVTSDLKRTAEALFHTPLQPQELAPEPSTQYRRLADAMPDTEIRSAEAASFNARVRRHN